MKSKKEVFPDNKTLKRIRDKLSDPSYEGGNLALPSGASEVDRAKYQACQLIAKYQREHGWMQKEVAAKLGVDESAAVVLHFATLIKSIDSLAKDGANQLYVEVVTKHGHRVGRPAAEQPELTADQ